MHHETAFLIFFYGWDADKLIRYRVGPHANHGWGEPAPPQVQVQTSNPEGDPISSSSPVSLVDARCLFLCVYRSLASPLGCLTDERRLYSSSIPTLPSFAARPKPIARTASPPSANDTHTP